MRISDWSSDVCSSDLCSAPERRPERKQSSARSENAPKRQAGAFHPMRSGRNVQKYIGFANLFGTFLNPITKSHAKRNAVRDFSRRVISQDYSLLYLLIISHRTKSYEPFAALRVQQNI